MEFSLKNKHGGFPVEVTIDEDNYRFTVRDVDTTGESFNSPAELVSWVSNNWSKEDFESPAEFEQMMEEILKFVVNS